VELVLLELVVLVVLVLLLVLLLLLLVVVVVLVLCGCAARPAAATIRWGCPALLLPVRTPPAGAHPECSRWQGTASSRSGSSRSGGIRGSGTDCTSSTAPQ
jgi:uncharacterized membrane protein YgcG